MLKEFYELWVLKEFYEPELARFQSSDSHHRNFAELQRPGESSVTLSRIPADDESSLPDLVESESETEGIDDAEDEQRFALKHVVSVHNFGDIQTTALTLAECERLSEMLVGP